MTLEETKEKFYGAWRLRDYLASSGGRESRPLGTHCTGQIHYSRLGLMTVAGVRGEEDGPADISKGDIPMFAYHGKFEVFPDHVMHYVIDSTVPGDARHAPQRRTYQFSPDAKFLTLSGSASGITFRLTWERI